jgi:hypothetical protein
MDGALLGVSVETISDVVRTILDGAPMHSAGPLFELVVAQELRKQPQAFADLQNFPSASRGMAASVRDLLSSGLTLVARNDALEAASTLPPGDATRLSFLIDLALRTEEQLSLRGLERNSGRADRAAALLKANAALYPNRHVFIFGFADCPGATRRLIEQLLSLHSTTMLLDNPALPESERQGEVHPLVARLLRRLHVQAKPRARTTTLPTTTAFLASRPDHEIEEVALRIRNLLDRGVSPERIAVVTRSLRQAFASLRRHFRAYGIPFSGGSLPRGLVPEERRASALIELLRSGPDTRLERWLRGTDADQRLLRVALQSLGLVTVRDLAGCPMEEVLGNRPHFQLPLLAPRAAAEREDDSEDDEETEDSGDDEVAARSMTVPSSSLFALTQQAQAWVDQFDAWTDTQSLGEHRTALHCLLLSAGSPEDQALAEKRWAPRLHDLEAAMKHPLPLLKSDFVDLLTALESLTPSPPLGGHGGGVQVLESLRARGLEFEHLFFLSVDHKNTAVGSGTDPHLDTDLRRALVSVLPDLAEPSARASEEAWLFDEISTSAAHVTWSWSRSDAVGKSLRVSSFLAPLVLREKLRPQVLGEHTPKPDLLAAPPRSHALRYALTGNRAATESWLAAVLDHGDSDGDAVGVPQVTTTLLARATFDVLESLEPAAPNAAPRVWPFVGITGAKEDDRQLFITPIESLFRCPWQTFLGKVLRIEPLPDPVAGSPGIHALTLGKVIHDVLERLLASKPGGDLAQHVKIEPTTLTRPDLATINKHLREASERIGRDDGIQLRGLRRVLEQRARASVMRALDYLFDTASARVDSFGTELEGRVLGIDCDGAPGIVRFRADYAERLPDGQLRVIDWKSSAGGNGKTKTPARIQAAAYAHADAITTEAQGAYVFLKDSEDPEVPSVVVPSSDPQARLLLEYALRNGLSLWRRGHWFPLLSTPSGKRPAACTNCNVKEACHQGDSGSKLRFERLANTRPEEAPELALLLQSVHSVYRAQESSDIKEIFTAGPILPEAP